MFLHIETRRMPGGNLEVKLEGSTGDWKNGHKRHVQVFELPPCEATDILEQKTRLVACV